MAKFSALPPELRLRIWDFALQQEAHDRLIIILQRDPWSLPHVVPLKHHASPLLSVNYESRNRTLAFYSIRLAVYGAPKASETTREQFIKTFHRYDPLKSIDDYFSTMERSSNLKGTLYISPQWDVFVVFPDLSVIFTYLLAEPNEESSDIRQNSQLLSRRYVTTSISHTHVEEINSVACVADQEREIGSKFSHPVYEEEEEETNTVEITQLPNTIFPDDVFESWSLPIFRKIKNYLYLRLTKAEMKDFIPNMIQYSGRGSYNFRDMAICLYDRAPELWVLFDRGELQKQDGEVSGPELKLKAFTYMGDYLTWSTRKQIEGYE